MKKLFQFISSLFDSKEKVDHDVAEICDKAHGLGANKQGIETLRMHMECAMKSHRRVRLLMDRKKIDFNEAMLLHKVLLNAEATLALLLYSAVRRLSGELCRPDPSRA